MEIPALWPSPFGQRNWGGSLLVCLVFASCAFGDGGALLLPGDYADGVIRLLLPACLSISSAAGVGQTLCAQDIIYDGVDGDHGLGIIFWVPQNNVSTVRVLQRSHRGKTTSSISTSLARVIPAPWGIISHARLTWNNWKLEVSSVTDGCTVEGTKSPPGDLLHDFNSQPRTFLEFSTRGVGIPVGLGYTMQLAVQPAFLTDQVVIGFQPDSNNVQLQSLQAFQSMAPEASASLSTEFVNRVLSIIQSNDRIYLGAAHAPNSVPIGKLRVDINTGTLSIAASPADLPVGTDVSLVSRWGGKDLTLQDISVANTNCGTLDTADCFKLKLKYNLGAALLKTDFSSVLLRPSGLQPIAPFVLGKRKLGGDLTLSKLTVQSGYIYLIGNLQLKWVQ